MCDPTIDDEPYLLSMMNPTIDGEPHRQFSFLFFSQTAHQVLKAFGAVRVCGL
jgi:hypothetical protein